MVKCIASFPHYVICDNDVVGINLRCSGQVCKCPIWTLPNFEDFEKENSFLLY